MTSTRKKDPIARPFFFYPKQEVIRSYSSKIPIIISLHANFLHQR